VGGGICTGSTRHVGHLLAYCTCPGWLWGWRIWWNHWQGKPKYSEKTCPNATLSTTNPTWPDPGSNPGRRGGKPATNRFSYGAALLVYLMLLSVVNVIYHKMNYKRIIINSEFGFFWKKLLWFISSYRVHYEIFYGMTSEWLVVMPEENTSMTQMNIHLSFKNLLLRLLYLLWFCCHRRKWMPPTFKRISQHCMEQRKFNDVSIRESCPTPFFSIA
jgi:hypothetical protein